MKPVSTFFLIVVFLLTGANVLVHASASFSNNNCSGTPGIKKILESAKENNKQDFLQSNNTGSGEQNDILFFVADKDEEQHDITRRVMSQTIPLTSFFYAFILNYSGNSTTDPHSFYKLPFFTGACKYIKQRSLRI